MAEQAPSISTETSGLVLSFSAHQELLTSRGNALRHAGYEVFSTTSEINARYEIEMGQCGVLLLCHTIHEAVRRDLATLFSNNCHGGIIAFVMHPSRQEPSHDTNLSLLDSGFSQQLHLLKAHRLRESA